MPEKKSKNDTPSLRTPHPKKLGLSVPALLRLPHEELIRPQPEQDDYTQAGGSKDSCSIPDTKAGAIHVGSGRQSNNESPGDPTRHADSARLANFEGAKPASLAKTDEVARQI